MLTNTGYECDRCSSRPRPDRLDPPCRAKASHRVLIHYAGGTAMSGHYCERHVRAAKDRLAKPSAIRMAVEWDRL